MNKFLSAATVALAAELAACSPIPELPKKEAGVEVDDGGMPLNDAGVTEITSQIDTVMSAAHSVINGGTSIEQNYARAVYVDTVVPPEQLLVNFEAFNNQVKIYSEMFGHTQAGIEVRISHAAGTDPKHPDEGPSVDQHNIFVLPSYQGTTENYYLHLGGSHCQVSLDSDGRVPQYNTDTTSLNCVSFASSVIKFDVTRPEVDAGVEPNEQVDAGTAHVDKPYTIDSCLYTIFKPGIATGEPAGPEDMTNLDNTPACEAAAHQIIDTVLPELKARGVCVPVRDDLSFLSVSDLEECK